MSVSSLTKRECPDVCAQHLNISAGESLSLTEANATAIAGANYLDYLFIAVVWRRPGAGFKTLTDTVQTNKIACPEALRRGVVDGATYLPCTGILASGHSP